VRVPSHCVRGYHKCRIQRPAPARRHAGVRTYALFGGNKGDGQARLLAAPLRAPHTCATMQRCHRVSAVFLLCLASEVCAPAQGRGGGNPFAALGNMGNMMESVRRRCRRLQSFLLP